ncbi:MAG: hypothetical protein AB203_03730 [Parcubacteria bacterium C7867-008]|nr:MAG: hypothetical protein AB203_03730 [Parcubacteria bacterium C7867-008]
MHNLPTRETAIDLRKQGYSYLYISKELGIPKSTLSNWLSKVPYKPNEEVIKLYGKARAAAGEKRAQVLKTELNELRETVLVEIGEITNRDLFIFGLAIYLGEGSKTNGIVAVSNSNPEVMRCMVAWFRLLGVETDQFTARMYIYPDLDNSQCLQFWSQATTIPESQFQKTILDLRSKKKNRTFKKLPFGTLHINVRARGRKEFGVRFARKIQVWSEVALEKIKERD